MNKPLFWKILGIVVVLVVLAVTAQRLPLIEWLRSLQGWFAERGFVGVLLYAGCYAVAAVALVPCLPLTIFAGVFFGFVRGITAVLIGSTLGAAIGFLIARALGRDAIAERLRHSRKFGLIDHAIGREGWKIVILLRMLPVPFGVSNYFYGLTAVSFSHYIIATVLGMLYGNVVIVYLGAIGKRSLESGQLGNRHPLEYVLIAVSIIAAFTISTILRRIAKNVVAE